MNEKEIRMERDRGVVGNQMRAGEAKGGVGRNFQSHPRGIDGMTFVPGRIPNRYKSEDGTFIPSWDTPRYKCGTFIRGEDTPGYNCGSCGGVPGPFLPAWYKCDFGLGTNA